MENGMVFLQKFKIQITILSSSSISEYVSKLIENRISVRYLHIHPISSIIYNSHDVEVSQVSIDGLVDKQCVVYA